MPVTYSQAGRLIALTTPLGADVLLLEKLTGTEAISELYRFDLDVLCLVTSTWTFDQLLGKSVTVAIKLPDDSSRYLNGIVSGIAQGDRVVSVLGKDTFVRYRLEVVPKLWLLTRRFQSRIFQQITVPDILKKVLTGLDVSWEIQGTFDQRDYCVQYHETDFAFASRLMEEEGIYYYFQHQNGSHKMVVANSPQSHVDVPGPVTVSYQPELGGLHPDDRIFRWRKTQMVRSGKVTLWDHCFELPGQNLEAVQSGPPDVQAGTVTHKQKVAGNDQMEVYDYPGLYAQRFDGVTPDGGDRASDVQKIFQDNKRTVGLRLKQESLPGLLIEGESNARQLAAGCKFTLADHFDGNGSYVLTRVDHEGSQEGVYTLPQPPDGAYENRFSCIPIALPYVPPMTTPRPRIPGTQSAVVVGTSGEEIFTDKYARVKVQFAWDRDGKKDASSSCWVRVGTFWAGKQWGAIHIPRIGQEVVVAFEEGDPDRPIIVGSVYNADQMPPYTLPDNKTQSGVKSRSTLQGAEDNFNELRFEDKKDSEEIYFHAEKDFNRVVENNDTLKVGFEKKDKGDQTVEIFNNQSVKVGAGATDAAEGSQTIDVFNSQTMTIGSGKANAKEGSQTIDVFNSQTMTIGSGQGQAKEGSQTVSVYKDRTTTIETGNDTLTVKKGNMTVAVSSGTISVEAAKSITLKVGSSTIVIDTSSITLKSSQITLEGTSSVTIKAPNVAVQGSASVDVKGPQIALTADGQLSAKGAIVQVNGSGMVKAQGGVVMIN